MITLTRRYDFSASHRLHLSSLTPENNAALYGKCSNPFGHGHNYRLEVTVAGTVHTLTGQIVPLCHLDQLIKHEVIDAFDHRYLNLDVEEFSTVVPTTENVLSVIADRLRQHWSDYIPEHAQLYRLHIQETDRNGFEAFFPVQCPVTPKLSQ